MCEVPKAHRKKKCAIKKRSKKGRNSEASSTMPPLRVLAVPPGGSEQLFDIAEAAPTQATRQKVKEKVVTSQDGSPLEQHVGSLQQQIVESSLQLNVESSPHMDAGYGSMDEGSTVRMDLSPIAPTAARRRPLDSDVFPEEPEHPTSDEGKFPDHYSLYSCIF